MAGPHYLRFVPAEKWGLESLIEEQPETAAKGDQINNQPTNEKNWVA